MGDNEEQATMGPTARQPREELAGVVRRVAATASLATLASMPAGDGRRWVLAEDAPTHDAWVIAWPSGTGLELHDHDGSIASICVVTGRLRERYLAADDTVHERWLDAGSVVDLPGDHRHEVMNVDGEEAISVHAYSPPLGSAATGDTAVEVAIVGAGASGLLTAAHLAREAARQGRELRIALVEPNGPRSAGLAFSTTCEDHLMNVRSCALTAYDDAPRHFVEWLSVRQGTVDPSGFAPRQAYGTYLHSLLADLPAGVIVERVQRRCSGLRRDGGDGVLLQFDDGGSLRAEQVVLALGHASPSPLGGPADVTVEQPWAPGAFDPIGVDDDVVLVGTGLTAVDAILSLEAAGHRGRIIAVSRHGRWPAAHATVPAVGGTVIDGAAIDTVVGSTARTLVALVRTALREALLAGDDWRCLVDSLRPHTIRLWRGLDDRERARFLRHARPLWEVHRHRMAPSAERRIEAMMATGRITTRAGRVRSITSTGAATAAFAGDRVTVVIASDGTAEELRARWVVNCTGPAADIRRRADPLVQDLLASGIAAAGWQGFGLDVDERGRVRDAAGRPHPDISAVGPLRLGADYESTAIPEIRRHGAALAERLLFERRGAAIADVA